MILVFMILSLVCSPVVVLASDLYYFVVQWETQGSGSGQFNKPKKLSEKMFSCFLFIHQLVSKFFR